MLVNFYFIVAFLGTRVAPSDGTTSHHFDFPTMDKENCKKT